MDSPPQIALIAFTALVICIGPALLVPGVLAYSGRWTSWVGPSGPKSTAKHSRLGFMMFWAGAPMTVMDVLLGLEALGVDASVTRDLGLAPFMLCVPIAMMHVFFLPKVLRPLLLPQWYRDWEDPINERDDREAEVRRARRKRLRKLPRAERRRIRLQEKGPLEPWIVVEVDQKVIWEKTSRY
ncbi:hypothetical protein NNX28_03095 [Arthrobacter sp. zg-Y859]|uniref:Uncharacterized protein n=1 Tax=Arthrobacter jinronghuae TaxID=2964609 RepID=A0ABT1NQ99_9MICC|nr:hypothetical protein [Arthrobacter jinronghuae]MCQ1948914.1 hypothetical protein [Arthrobacter jinronghuae]MCQ1955643.1 hypothetical protein [Arthrobacter jinronghuae]UWX78282.1 hypothetical protein N2K98_15170 [Arthrobacter jinronghuae]